jgi:hypothetical protein
MARGLHEEFAVGLTSHRLRDPFMPSLRQLTSSLASALALSALAVGVVARGEVITSNIADPNPDGGSFVSSGFPQRAQAFSSTVSGTMISTVKMDLASSTLTQPFSIKLYNTGTSGLPGSSVATIFSGTGGDIILGASPFTVSGLSVVLAPSTQYFMVFERQGTFSGQWNFNLETTGLGDGFEVDNSFSTTTVDDWNSISTIQPYRMEIVAVPEPPAIVLSGIGLASAMYAFRRRRG